MIQISLHGTANVAVHRNAQVATGCRRQTRCPRPRAVNSFRSKRDFTLQAAGGDGGAISGGGDIGGKGPRYTTSSSDNNDESKDGSWFRWKGWEDRVAYDPEFPFKVFLEQVIGVAATALGDMSSRPNWGLNELDFVFSTLVVGSIMNFSLMYLLAPTAAVAGGVVTGSIIQRLLSGEFLSKWGAPGGNMFEPGFGLSKRLLNFGYKGLIFASIGMMAGIIGTATSNGLLALRKKLDPTFQTQNTPPDILFNAGTWACHMGVSSNLRYQILGGTDQILVKLMPSTAFRIYSTGIRTTNNIVGGISFVTLARFLGVQKASEPAAATA